MLHTPVLFLIFNRPDTTAQVFEAIRQAKPKQLFIAADGPREGRPDDLEKCKKAREIALQVDWECEVRTLFREKNLGCKYAVSSAIDWFFENVEEGIILEDDTLPDQSFFNFCEQLLAYYRDHERIMHIGGVNFQLGKHRGKASYYFSKYSHVWGWATWRRAWRYYSVDVNCLGEIELLINIKQSFSSTSVQNYWINLFNELKQNNIDTWDYQWNFTVWNTKGLSIVPNFNLVTNIGFGVEATHTKNPECIFSNTNTFTISTIIHPIRIQLNKSADLYTYKMFINPPTKLINKIRNFAYMCLSEKQIRKIKRIINR
jgi:hypothetical protein